MKKLAYGIFTLLALSTLAYAASLSHYQPGPRLIDGTQLNLMVDQVNGLTNAGVSTAIASGETALDGSNPTPVTTGLTSIAACTLTIKASSITTGTSVVSYQRTGGTLNMYGWKPTTTSTTTLTASTGTDTIGWICTGVR